jgi:hypothetical protein
MANILPEEKVAKIVELLREGKSDLEVSRITGCSKITVKTYKKCYEIEAKCECGLPAGHQAWCSHRFNKSAGRQIFHFLWTHKLLKTISETGQAKAKMKDPYVKRLKRTGRATTTSHSNFHVCNAGVRRSGAEAHCAKCSATIPIRSFVFGVGYGQNGIWTQCEYCISCANTFEVWSVLQQHPVMFFRDEKEVMLFQNNYRGTVDIDRNNSTEFLSIMKKMQRLEKKAQALVKQHLEYVTNLAMFENKRARNSLSLMAAAEGIKKQNEKN